MGWSHEYRRSNLQEPHLPHEGNYIYRRPGPPGEAPGRSRGGGVAAGVGVGVGGIGGGFTNTELLGTTEFGSVESWPGVVVVWLAAG